MRGPRKNSLANVGGLDSYQVRGLQETFALLDQLTSQAAGQVLQQAMRAALRPVRNRARQLAPLSDPGRDPKLESGLLKKAIVVQVKKGKGGIVYGKVGVVKGKFAREAGTRTRGPLKGKTWWQDPGRYAHLVEFGTRGSRARPFLRPAWDQTRAQALDALRQKVSDVIAKWSKQGKLGKKLRGF